MFKNHKAAFFGLIVVSLIAMSLSVPGIFAQSSGEVDLAPHSHGAWGVDLTGRDPAVKPGDNFYMSQNGAWFARTDITTGNASYWRDLRRLSPLRLAAVLEEAAAKKNAAPGGIERKAGAFYRSFIDQKTREAKGITPLKPELDAIRHIKTKSQMAASMGREAGPGTQRATSVPVPNARGVFSLNIGQDQADPNRYAVYIGQNGILLPGPEFYLDPKLADFKAAYQAYAARLLTLIGWPNAESRAKEIVAFETRIAEVSWSHEQMLDAVKTYNPMTVEELSKFAPGFEWKAFLNGAELGKVNSVVIDAKGAFPKIAAVFAETPLDVLQARQAFASADSGAARLNSAMVKANFDFRGTAFQGPSVKMMPLNMLGEQAVEASVPDIMGAFYVARYFSPEAKAKALEMTANLKAALDQRLQQLSWMDSETKAKAREKLAKMRVNIGYPDKFQDYKGLAISESDLFGNVERASAFNWRRQVRRLNDPFDRSEWTTMPNFPQYNYIPTANTVEIPAATLQPPFFDLKADEAVNYGAVGAVIGQTIMSGFDQNGRFYDHEGRRQDWWTAKDIQFFDAEAKKLSEQYSAIEPIPGVHVNGELVLNEAIDDLGGLLIAIDGYHISLQGKSPPVLDGTTGDQRVFLGRAHMWRAKFNLGFVRNQLATGSNAPPFVRVNGPIRNMDTWYEAFEVKPGDKMYIAPEDRVRIW